MLRHAKIVMTFALSAFAFLATFNNVTDYGSNFEFVKHVLSMDTTFQSAMYRSIDVPALWHLAYWIIIAGEGLTFLLLFMGALKMFLARSAPAEEFDRSKRLMVAGAAAGFLVWFFLFMVVGGEWFLMWQSPTWNGQEAAFRFYMTILVVLVFVIQPERDNRKA